MHRLALDALRGEANGADAIALMVLLQGQRGCPLCRAKLTPLGESGGAVQLEIGSGVEAAFLIEMIEDRGVNGGELLETCPGILQQTGRRR